MNEASQIGLAGRHGDATQPARGFVRRSLVLFGLPCVLLVAAMGSSVWLLSGGGDRLSEGPVSHMEDLATDLAAGIASLTQDGLAKTEALAADPRVAEVIAGGDRAAAEHLANALLAQSLELDIVAIFDGGGLLLAVNTIGHDGLPVRQSGLETLYGSDFSERGVVQDCLRNETVDIQMEFQTRCDFTPAFYGSSGLSVAMSAPVYGGEDGARVGVVSTRLRFERVTELVRENSYVRAGNSVYLVSDDGRFFDERINGGEEPQPLPREQVVSAITSVSGDSEHVVVKRGEMVLLGHRVPVASAIAGGGMHVLLRASNGWVMAEAAQARVLAGAILILSLGAMGIWGLYANARADRLRTQVALSTERTKMSLILENVGEGVLGLDAGGRVSFVNATAEALLGSPAGELIGRAISDLVPARGGGGTDRAWKYEDTPIVGGRRFHARISFTLLPERSGGVMTFSDLTDRKATERDLLEATRLAGKAEVATSVLHNVGNVLNSINVSASVVAEMVRASEVASLVSASALIREHRADLGEFLSSDERGRHLPEFLIEVAECLGVERDRLLSEIEGVLGGVEHVRHVVNMQQAHAKNPNLVSEIAPGELMDAALEMQQDTLSRHEVKIERCYESMGVRLLDKHQVLQILMNLVRNARQAMNETRQEDRRLTLGVREVDQDGRAWVEFEVRDNGIGIAEEHRTGIFAHGFTTRSDGHGFGLHTSANSARQMGGSIDMASEGLGKGARFVLRLPADGAPEPEAQEEAGCTAS